MGVVVTLKISLRYHFSEFISAHRGVFIKGRKYKIVRPAVARFGFFGSDYEFRGFFELVCDFDHLHEAGVHAEHVERLSENAVDRDKPYAEIASAHVVIRIVVIGDALERACGVAFFPARAVVPYCKHIIFGRIVFRRPFYEFNHFLEIAHIDFAEVRDIFRFESPVVRARLRVPARDEIASGWKFEAVYLDHHINIAAQTGFFHFFKIGDAEFVEVVIGVEENHECPFFDFGFFRRNRRGGEDERNGEGRQDDTENVFFHNNRLLKLFIKYLICN
ncbi:MAG: hypothetical protein ACD_47C00166G0002 [uncultured bacterium]|nr:MAG: hypothetical protein ACD_47C00166G0002 [uncultured bacterium]